MQCIEKSIVQPTESKRLWSVPEVQMRNFFCTRGGNSGLQEIDGSTGPLGSGA